MEVKGYELDYIEKWLPEASVKYKDGSPAVNLGLIITVFFKDGHTSVVRRKMVECVDKFFGEFKSQLKKTLTTKWVGITDNNYAKKRQGIIDSTPEEIFSWYLGSAEENYLAPDYSILIMGERIYHNESNRSVIKLAFPLSLLSDFNGKEKFESWLLWLSNTFEVESGYAGLSFVLPYNRERMFPYEYQLAKRFPGVIVDSIGTLEGGGALIGLKSASWYTILGNPWLEKLGGREKLNACLKDTPAIEQLNYNSGIILKAGHLPPALGETKTEDLPPLLIRVNKIIRPIRFNKPRSFHFYSEYEDFQFETESTMQWIRRFDDVSDLIEEAITASEPVRITCWTDEVSPHAGEWAAIVKGTTQYIQVPEGKKMPLYEDKEGNTHKACWTLLKRDDGGKVFIFSDD